MRNTGLFLLLILPALTARAQQDCVLKKDSDSIRVYTCASTQSRFKMIRATFTIDAHLSELAAFILDVQNYTSWQYNTADSKLIQKVNDNEVLYYAHITAPWTVSDRDMVVRLKIVQDSKTHVVTITAKSTAGLVPENEKMVRVPLSDAKWTVVPVGPSRLEVDYHIQIDPGGSIPAWMINMVAAQAPYVSFKNLKDKIHARKYVPGEVPFIVD